MIRNLNELPHVGSEFIAYKAPLVHSEHPLSYWARESGQSLYLFIANPQSRGLKFPLEYGQSYCMETIEIPLTISWQDQVYKRILEFPPNQSLLFEIKNGHMEQVDIYLQTRTPVVKERPADFESPWLVH